MIRHIIKHRLAPNPVNNRALHDYEILPPHIPSTGVEEVVALVSLSGGTDGAVTKGCSDALVSEITNGILQYIIGSDALGTNVSKITNGILQYFIGHDS